MNPPPSSTERRRHLPASSNSPNGPEALLDPPEFAAREAGPSASIVERIRRDQAARNGAALDTDGAAVPVPRGKSFSQQFAAAMRWLHIYVSLLAFAALVFFGATGITLNHPQWFDGGEPRLVERQGTMDAALVRHAAGADPEVLTTRLEVVEFLRAAHALRGAVSEFRTDEFECLILFKGPGYSADVVVSRTDGSYQLTETLHGVVAMMNDLHKGRDTGSAWSIVIDVVSLATVFVSLTGLVLIFYLKRKRVSGILVAVAGTVLLGAVAWWLVP